MSTMEIAPYTGLGARPLTDAERAYVGHTEAARGRGYSLIQSA
jgi:hypothetical protein